MNLTVKSKLYCAVFLINFVSVATFIQESGNYPIVTLKEGVISGFVWETDNNNIYAFQGIPYAQPPVGVLRFQAPEPALPWTGVLNATYEGRMCPQDNMPQFFEVIGDEDCLYLNVYVPKKMGINSLLPVVVFIHGGTFQLLSGTSLFFGPKKLLNFDVILVTLNYRLGPLGFLSTGDEASPGNFGLLDQVLALKWVKENIENFGGNPNEVTLMGQSSGAMSISAHLVSPLTKGLFSKAILESGTIFAPNMFNYNPLPRAKQLAEIMKCPTYNTKEMIRCLKTKPASELVYSGNNMDLPDKEPIVPRFVPVVDKFLLPDYPEKLFQDGKFHQIPILTGVNDNEVLALYWIDLTRRFILKDELKFWLKNKFSIVNSFSTSIDEAQITLQEIEEKLLDDNDLKNETSFRLKLSKFFTVGFYLAPQIKLLKYIWRRNPSYVYVFDYRGRFSFLDMALLLKDNYTVTHADEIPFLFSGAWDLFKHPEEDKRFDNIFLQLFSNFMKYGNPSPDGHPVQWDPVSSDDIEYLRIAKTFSMNSKHQEAFVSYFNEILPARVSKITK